MELDQKIQSLLKDFYSISGIRVSIHDNKFNEIYSFTHALTHLCKCILSIPDFKAQCIASDTYAFSVVKKTNQPYVYKCKYGLFEAVAPIYNYGRLTGYLMLGQVRDNDTKILDGTLEILKKYNTDNSELQKAYNSIINLDLGKLYSYINIMTVLAEHFTLTNKLSGSEESLPFLVNKEIINNHSKDLTLEKLSKKFGCSISTLTSLYKKEYNIRIHKFIINTRLEQAKRLLEKSDKAIKEISEECGFYDQNHFYRTFKKTYNISPSSYRALKTKKHQS